MLFLTVLFLIASVNSRVIHEYVGIFSDPREDIYLYREIQLKTALPVNLTLLFNRFINSSDLFLFDGLRVYNPRCGINTHPEAVDFCTQFLDKNHMPIGNHPISTFIPLGSFHPVPLGSKVSEHTSSIRDPGYATEVKLCFKTMREFQDQYACWTGKFIYTWNKTETSPSGFKLQLFKMQLIALQSSLDFTINLDYDKEGDIYWKKIYNIQNNFQRHMSCDFRSPGMHDPDHCQLPFCDEAHVYVDCISRKKNKRMKRQWDVASFAIATGAAVLAGLNRAEIEHLKGEISTLTAASKAHEEQVLKLSGKLVSFMKTTNEAFDSVHNQIDKMAKTTAKHMETLAKNMEYLLKKDAKLQLAVDEMAESINSIMRVLLVEIQNRVANYVDSIRLAAIMYHEGRVHRIKNAIASKIISEDMISRKQLKDSFFSPQFLDGLRESGLTPLFDENSIDEYLQKPVFSAVLINQTSLELAIRVPVKRSSDTLYAYRLHCLPVVYYTEGSNNFVKDYCPSFPYLIIYDTKKVVYYELELDHRLECFHGTFSVCPSFLHPKRLNTLPGLLPCYVKQINSHPDSHSEETSDTCSENKVLSDGSTEVIITDSGKLYLSIAKTEATLIGIDGSVHSIPKGDFIPIEAKCGARLITGEIEYKLPSLFCDQSYDVVIARHKEPTTNKFSQSMILSENADIASSINNMYKILMSQHMEIEKPPGLPEHIASDYLTIIEDSKKSREKLTNKITSSISDLEADAKNYKKKLDELHAELDISNSYLFWFVIAGFVGACFLFLDILFAIIIGQTICGMVARWRRGESVLRKPSSNYYNNRKDKFELTPLEPSNKVIIKTRFIPKLKTSYNKLDGFISFLSTFHAENFYDLTKLNGKQISVSDEMIASADHCLRSMLELVVSTSKKSIQWLENLLENQDFPSGTIALISYKNGIDVPTDLSFLSENDKLEVASVVRAPPNFSGLV